MFSSTSLEEAGSNTPPTKRSKERRLSEPHEYNSKRERAERTGSLDKVDKESAATLTRRDKTTGRFIVHVYR